MFKNKESQLQNLAQILFTLVDEATNESETQMLCKVIGELKPVLDNAHIHPDLGLELMEFADLKDDFLSRGGADEVGLKEGLNRSKQALVEILKA